MLAFGIILLIIGVLFFMTGYNAVEERRGILSQIGRGFSERERQEYQTNKVMETGGAIVALVGLVLSIAGAVGVEKPVEKLERKVKWKWWYWLLIIIMLLLLSTFTSG